MGRLFCLATFAVITPTLSAQSSMDRHNYRIDYVKESHLLRKGNHLTVVNVDLEWPVRLSSLPTTALEQFLCNEIFGCTGTDHATALSTYLNELGKEVQQMPDEAGLSVRHVNYVLEGLCWVKNKYISMRLVGSFRDGDKAEPDSIINVLFTYDVIADKVLRAKDILIKDCYRDIYARNDLAWCVLEFLPEAYFKEAFDYIPEECCFMPKGLLLNVPNVYDEDGFNPMVLIDMGYFANKHALKTWNGKSKPGKDRKKQMDASIQNVSENFFAEKDVYEVVDSMPRYNGDTKDMLLYLKRQVSYPEYELNQGIEGRVTVSFVVERDGSISSPSVISPVSPGLDRQAVEAVMSMPRWVPGMKNGVAVRTRMTVPVYFKLEKQ